MDDLINPQEIAENWDYDYKLPREPVVGDAVIIRGIGEGEIVEIKKDNIFVKSGLFKTRVKLSDIMLTEKKEKDRTSAQSLPYVLTCRCRCENSAGFAWADG